MNDKYIFDYRRRDELNLALMNNVVVEMLEGYDHLILVTVTPNAGIIERNEAFKIWHAWIVETLQYENYVPNYTFMRWLRFRSFDDVLHFKLVWG